MNEEFTITASVAPDALSKVTRLFNASLDDIVAELLQNARRAGARRVSFSQFTDLELGDVISVADNGPGIEAPTHLFELGGSGWDRQTCASEDAAGMGFFALAGRDIRVIVQKAGDTRSWILRAGSGSFSGRQAIKAAPGPADHKGVTVLFAAKPHENIVPAANRAAKFCPVVVDVEGVEVEREDYLSNAIHIEEWRGIRIGVFKGAANFRHPQHNSNFHGLTLNIPLPGLSQQHHDQLHARLDVISCRDLKLVLPARKEVVQDDFYQDLREQVKRACFNVVAEAGSHSLSFKDHKRAGELGIDLPEAAAKLRPFTPSRADRDSNSWPAPVNVVSDSLLFSGADEAVEEQNFARAIAQDQSVGSIYEPNSAFEGYAWYDAIPQIEVSGFAWLVDGRRKCCAVDVVPSIIERPERLFVMGHFCSQDTVSSWEAETDLLLFAPPDAHIDETLLCVVKDAELTVDELVGYLTDALFCPSDDVEAGSYDSQLQWFTDEAEDTAIAYLQSPSDVHRNQVERVVKRELYWILRPSSEITIEIMGRDVEVHGLETAFGQSLTS